MFQSFPLGDRSSVNLRGEFHVENATIYENLPSNCETKLEDEIQVDQKEEIPEAQNDTKKVGGTPVPEQEKGTPEQPGLSSKTVKFDARQMKPHQSAPDMDTLYPIFWSLQENFSIPTRLFEETNLQTFRSALEVTMLKFKEVHLELQARGASKIPEDNKRGVKRMHDGQEDELSGSFNPKYLTSRDLFDLEVNKDLLPLRVH